jgi:hypothetical protein
MKQADQQKQQLPVSTAGSARTWLLGSIAALLLLMVAALLVVPQLIDYAVIERKIQDAVSRQTGGQVDYQGIGISYFPRPSIELRQITLSIPDLAEGTIAALRISPEILPLLTGDLHLARLELDTPRFSLKLPDLTPREDQSYAFAELKKNLTSVLEPLEQMIAELELQVGDARLAFTWDKQKLAEIDGLNLQAEISVTNLKSANSARVDLQANLAELSMYRNGHHALVKGLDLNGSAQLLLDRMSVQLDRLALDEPNLELTGDLSLTPAKPAITLNLSGTGINVDAVRKIVLTLAGDSTGEVFNYLRGGRVPQIGFTFKGDNPSELGDLNNILIKGQLQDGKVSIPQIELDLTEVYGDVLISEGILQGSGLSARLDKSTGREGSLQIGLTKDHDLFKLELMLSADLADTQSMLQRLIDGRTFSSELDKITNMQGIGHGKLTLGDSLHDLKAKIDISNLTLSANYLGIPFPITISQGQLAFNKEQLDLSRLSGSLGQSKFADVSCQFLWQKDLFFDIGSGRFDLDMTELYPWLASLEGLRNQLQEVRQVTGRLELSSLKVKGPVDRPSELQFASTGTVKDLSVETEFYPDIIKVADGGFTVETEQLTFKNLRTTSQDTELFLTGSVQGFPQPLDRIELSLDGSMGPKLVEWLSDRFEVPKTYAIRAPLGISKVRISWQPNATSSFNGLVSIEKGPVITADIDYQPGQLQVHQLNIKDQYSDAAMVFELKKAERDFKFTGNLQHETLQAMFVDDRFSNGRLEGDFSVTVPQDRQARVTTTGQLTGENLPVPLSSGDKIIIEQIMLKADGTQVKADITKLTWKDLAWEPVKGTVSFDRDQADVRLTESKLCGINAPGQISFTGGEISLNMTLDGKDLDVATSYSCLTKGRSKATGSLDFSSKITARGKMNDLVKNLRGPLEITLSKGVFEQNKVLSRTLEVLNVTEIVKGRLPDLSTSGLAYNTTTLQGKFQNGKLIIDKFFMDGETLTLVGNGEVLLEGETIKVQLLAAPFKTVDSIVKHIPGINYILGGTLVTIPVSITGTLDDPHVTIMSASAIGSSLFKLAERTIKSPFKLLEMINPWSKQND